MSMLWRLFDAVNRSISKSNQSSISKPNQSIKLCDAFVPFIFMNMYFITSNHFHRWPLRSPNVLQFYGLHNDERGRGSTLFTSKETHHQRRRLLRRWRDAGKSRRWLSTCARKSWWRCGKLLVGLGSLIRGDVFVMDYWWLVWGWWIRFILAYGLWLWISLIFI